jgi:hypothetical protein
MAGTRLYDQWAYSHWNDPGVQAWREDMSRQAQNDAELRAKLDTLNAKVTELQAQKAPVTEALPEGIDPSLVVAPRTVMLATASSGFNWWWIGVPVLILVILVLLSLKIANDRRRIV